MPDFTPENSEIKPLIDKLGGVLSAGSCIVTFIAAQSGEGTSSIAAACAHTLHTDNGKKVLLISPDGSDIGLVELVTSKTDLSMLTSGSGIAMVAWQTPNSDAAQSGRVLQDMIFWHNLRSLFDVVVIDAPALQKSADGIAFARMAETTVIVVEAEVTRKEVIENLRDTLTASGARIAGVILNKRTLHIPAKSYKRL